MTMTLSTDQLALVQMCLPDYATIRSYSGRFMYGSQCIAFALDGIEPVQFIAEFICALAQEDVQFTQDLVDQSIQWDNLGLGAVVYFPRVHFPESSRYTVKQFYEEE